MLQRRPASTFTSLSPSMESQLVGLVEQALQKRD